MSKIKIIAGDLPLGTWELNKPLFTNKWRLRKEFSDFSIDVKEEIEHIQIQTEESVKKLSGMAGWGLAGAAVLGPIGAIGGLLIGGRKTEICFTAQLKNGQKFLSTTDSKTYKILMAELF